MLRPGRLGASFGTTQRTCNVLARSRRTQNVIVARAMSSESSSLFERIKNFFLFRPGASDFLNYPNKSIAGKGYRYPSPASRTEKQVKVPSVENEDLLYNIQYYTRDTRRQDRTVRVISKEAMKLLPTSLPEKTGSPGNKNPAVLRYDPTGTRSAMTTTHHAVEAELAKHAPNHLPVPFWANDKESLSEECERKGIPPTPGRQARWNKPEMHNNW